MKHRSQRGANLVEAALVLLMLFLLMFAIIEFGHAYSVYQTITNAAREGARFAVAPYPGTNDRPVDTDVQTTVCNYLNAGGVTCTGTSTRKAAVSVCRNCPTSDGSLCTVACATTQVPITGTFIGGTPVNYTKVDVSVPYRLIALPYTVTIHTEAVMSNEPSE